MNDFGSWLRASLPAWILRCASVLALVIGTLFLQKIWQVNMTTLELVGLGGIVATFISAGIAIYELAVIIERKKGSQELQHLLAGIHQLALSKALNWQQQLSVLGIPRNEHAAEVFRLHMRARDDFQGIAAAINGLEGVINSQSSAITKMLEKSIETAKLNSELQKYAPTNPIPNAEQVDQPDEENP